MNTGLVPDFKPAAERSSDTTGRRLLSKFPLGVAGLSLAMLVGAFAGVGTFTFHYGEGLSYFSTDPNACANCHIMRPHLDSWHKSSHHAVAGCVDCHLPEDFIPKYIAKADNGWRHSWAFTFQDFHEPIQITPRNSQILQDNCLRCHGPLVHELVSGATTDEDAVSCVSCHATIGHGPTR